MKISIRYLSNKDWMEFIAKHPQAANFLFQKCRQTELEALQRQAALPIYLQSRVEELKAFADPDKDSAEFIFDASTDIGEVEVRAAQYAIDNDPDVVAKIKGGPAKAGKADASSEG